MKKFLLFLCLLPMMAQAQDAISSYVGRGVSVPGPFQLTVEDNSACSNTTVPTNTLLGNSTFPSLPSGMSYLITNTHTDQTCSSSHVFTWPQATLSGGSWTYNAATTSLLWTMNGNTGDSVYAVFPSGTVQTTISRCTPIYTDMPQNTTSSARIDLQANQTSNTLFTTGQFQPNGTNILVATECGGTQQTGNTCPSGEGSNGTFPTSTWKLMCAIQTVGSTPSGYLGLWDPPAGSLCDGSPCGTSGGLIANSIVISLPATVAGSVNLESQLNGPAAGTGAGTSGDHIWTGTTPFCGMTSAQSTCPFPAGWGLQFPSVNASPGSGNYTSGQTVALSDYSPGVSIYYTTCSTAGCTPTTPTTASTLYSGTFTATPPEAVSAIAALTGHVTSSTAQFTYVSPNATYVGGAFATGSGSTTLAVTGLSIPSGDIIICGNGNSANGNTGCTDSHSDTPSCTSVYADSGNGDVEICVMKAGATVSSVTCSQTFSGHTQNCAVSWYSPGTLAGTLDTSTGGDNSTISTWTTGTSSSLAGSNELIVGFWQSCCSTVTSTPTDGSTNRSATLCTGTYNCEIQDRTAWNTAVTSVTGTWNVAASGAAVMVAIK